MSEEIETYDMTSDDEPELVTRCGRPVEVVPTVGFYPNGRVYLAFQSGSREPREDYVLTVASAESLADLLKAASIGARHLRNGVESPSLFAVAKE